MAYTQEQYVALCQSIALGAREVKYADKTIVYNTFSEMNQLKRQMEVELGIITARSRKRIGVYNKGLTDPRSPLTPAVTSPIQASPQTKSDTIIISVVTSPNPAVLYPLRNGSQITAQYPPGSSIIIPYLATPGIYVKRMFYIGGQYVPTVSCTNYTITNTAGDFFDGDVLTFEIEYQS